MIQEALAFREEVEELGALLDTLEPREWERPTPFKEWTSWDVIAHLHWGDLQALLAARDADAFRRAAKEFAAVAKTGTTLTEYTRERLQDLDATELTRRWQKTAEELSDHLKERAPRDRIVWYGPDMGARMFATARQMETWAHAQDIYDLFGLQRRYSDRIENIAVIGVKTFGWTFANRRLAVPETLPHVRLAAPSGASWEWNAPSETERVAGSAADFCHVVTQGRNVADTGLEVVGEVATRWMSIAQCFAGPPADPPLPGQRI